MKLRRAIPLHSIDPSLLGPNSPLLELMRRKPRADREHQEQVKLFAWAAENELAHPELRWMFAVPNWIGVRTAKHGARLKAEGRKVGVLDVWLPVARKGCPGLVVEMKIKPNALSKEQRDWKTHLEGEGWRVRVAYTADEAIGFVMKYLDRLGNG